MQVQVFSTIQNEDFAESTNFLMKQFFTSSEQHQGFQLSDCADRDVNVGRNN